MAKWLWACYSCPSNLHGKYSQNETHIPFSVETAVNIAYSCRIFKDEMDAVFMVEGTDRETVLEELRYTQESSCSRD